MKRSGLMTLLTAAALGSTGCTTMLKQGYYAVRGAEGSFYELEAVQPAVLASYRALRVEPFENELGVHVPGDVVTQVRNSVPTILASENLFYPSGNELRVTGRIIHYTGRSGLPGAAMSVVSGGETCVCRVQLLDAETGERLGEAVCWGEVKSALRRGASEFGTGVGKGVAAWFKERMPKDVAEARRAELKP